MNFQKYIDDKLPFLTQLEGFFKRLGVDSTFKAIHDGDDPKDPFNHHIEFANYIIAPATAPETNTFIGWGLTYLRDIPGRFNPWDGGSPPDVEEVEMGVFDNPEAAVATIVQHQFSDACDNARETLMQAQAAREQAEAAAYERDHSPASELCPHNKPYHECNDCMARADEAYDAMHERLTRRWGR